METPLYAAERLEHLFELARSAETPFEKASVYAATEAVKKQLLSERWAISNYAREKTVKACRHIKVIVGYAESVDVDSDRHVTWALGAIKALKKEVEETVQA